MSPPPGSPSGAPMERAALQDNFGDYGVVFVFDIVGQSVV